MLFLPVLLVLTQPTEVKLTLRPSQLLCEEAVADVKTLVDEQALAGDPATGKTGKPQTEFFPGWHAPWRYPVHVTIDLGTEHTVTRLFLYNNTGTSEIGVAAGKPFAWSTEKNLTRDKYQDWCELRLDTKTRYLRLTIPKPTALQELVVYGTPTPSLGNRSSAALTPHKPKVSFDQFVGTNAFIDDPLDKITGVAGFVREYHSWAWDTENLDRKTRFNPSAAAGGNSWFFDDYYKKLSTAGVTVVPAIQGNIAGQTFNDKPDLKTHAAHLFQFAARYGSKKVADSALSLAPGQPRVSGLGTLRYLENWNEPDKTWEGRSGWFTPFELAAMCAADEDAIHRADPKMPLVLGGLAGLSLDYLTAMQHWAEFNRGGRFPASVINLHHYCTDGGEQGFGKTGISPEADNLRGKLAAVAKWRDTNAPHCELWLTEFGWDTDPRSPIHCPTIKSMDAQIVQAAWLVRAYLLLAAAGVDRAAMFMLRDVNSTGGGVFETCGLVTQKGEWKPKPSWFWVATLKNRLAGYRFIGDLPTGRADVLALRFSNGSQDALALWCPTAEDKTVKGFKLPVNVSKATAVHFTTGSTTGAATALVNLTLDISEKPTLVFLRK